ncbi:MAG: 50S ribosomal protein L28 [Deltaproteobacteria bacterium]|nr:50S ribosomal protein L28 [Deltaproteobacteria bacterium]
MSQQCQVTGKKPLSGNNVSHSNRKTRRRWEPNIRWKRFFVPSQGRWIRLRVSTSAIREINKRGIELVLSEIRASGKI